MARQKFMNMLLIALMVFYIFKNLRLNYNSLVNILGKYSAGAYLLHGGASFIKDYLWDGLFKVDIFYYLRLMFMPVLNVVFPTWKYAFLFTGLLSELLLFSKNMIVCTFFMPE